jgi:6-phospho-3-hexuloisomerase
MQPFLELAETIVRELGMCLSAVSANQVTAARNAIDSSERIFVAGAGRSGLAVRALAMRLMHFGKQVVVVGDVTTPAIVRNDLLLIGSGYGSTGSLQVMARLAHSVGARILLITIVPESSIGQLSDCVVCIPAPSTKVKDAAGIVDSVQPTGSLFEQTLLLGDALVLSLMGEHGIDSDVMFTRHANLE